MLTNEFIPLADTVVVEAAEKYFDKMIFEPLGINGNAWIAGGCLREWLQEKRIAKGCDVDVWCRNEAEADRIRKEAKKAKWTLTAELPTSLNYKTNKGQWVQIIRQHYFDGPVETIAAFDFTVCAFALTSSGAFWMHQSSLLDMAMMRLMVIDLQFPQSTLRRTYKYAEKGYRICGGELGKVVDAIVAEAKEKELIEATDPIGSEQAVAPVMSGGGRWNGLD
jgi:hypothetical protein